VNPYGPAEPPDRATGFYSDGIAVWRYDPADPAAPPDSLGLGAFPASSWDGHLLAAAVPAGVDSTSGFCNFGLCPCVQETATFTSTGWATLVYDLAAGTLRSLAFSAETFGNPDVFFLRLR
jgi:hypothetical protein